MRKGLKGLQAFAGVMLIGGGFVACGDDGGGDGAGGGSSSTTETGTGAVTGSTAQTVVTGQGTGVTGPTTTTGTGGTCSITQFFGEPDCDGCLINQCCSQAEACLEDYDGGGTNCLNADGSFIPEGSLTTALFDCLDDNCLEQCSGSGICDSGLVFNDPEINACLSNNCCDEFNACTGNGVTVQECIDCLSGEEADFSRCQAANDCSVAECDTAIIFYPICDSGLGTGSESRSACLSENCCDQYNACTGDGSEAAIQACLDSCNGASGSDPDLCAPVQECASTECPIPTICGTELTYQDDNATICVNDNCCDSFGTCIGDGSQAGIDACNACLTAGGGALCDSYLECIETNCAEFFGE